VLVEQDGETVGGALLVEQTPGVSGMRLRILRPPGFGVSDYLDLLLPAEPRLAATVAERLLEWLVAEADWHLLDLPRLPAESLTADRLTSAAADKGLRFARVPTYARPFITLNGDWSTYLASRSAGLRFKIRKSRRLLGQAGPVSYRHYSEPDEVLALLPRCIEVHARRWTGQYTSTTFSSAASARHFYQEAIRGLAASGQLDLATLEIGAELLAFCLGFIGQRRYYYYLPAFDPTYSRQMPGVALLAHLIEFAFSRQLAEFDFMIGEEAYKDRWSTGERLVTRLVLAQPSLRGALALEAFTQYLTLRERARRSERLLRLRRYGLLGRRQTP
jgi:CelD/BcsL family acetyltransferase involved in cellulose biosynthesis